MASTHSVVGTLADARNNLDHTHKASIVVDHLELGVRVLDTLHHIVEAESHLAIVIVVYNSTAVAGIVVRWEPRTTVIPENEDILVCRALLLTPVDEVGKGLWLVKWQI